MSESKTSKVHSAEFKAKVELDGLKILQAKGLSNDQIAQSLFISLKTAKNCLLVFQAVLDHPVRPGHAAPLRMADSAKPHPGPGRRLKMHWRWVI